MGCRLLRRTLPLGDWQTNLARFSLAVDAGCGFARPLARFRTRPREMFRLVAETLGIIESGAAEKNVWRQVWDATLQAS